MILRILVTLISENIRLLIDSIPNVSDALTKRFDPDDSISNVAPFRVVNIGNSQPIPLVILSEHLKNLLVLRAVKNFMPMQAGDVRATWADTSLLEKLTGYSPNTNLLQGVQNFVDWYRQYYDL